MQFNSWWGELKSPQTKTFVILSENTFSSESGFPGELQTDIIQKSPKYGSVTRNFSISSVFPLQSLPFLAGSVWFMTMLFFIKIREP